MILDKKAILAAEDLETQTIPVPEWGGEVILKTMTGAERDQFESSLFDSKGKSKDANMKNLRAKLLANCLVNEDGERIFSHGDITGLSSKSSKVLDRLYEIASEMNGIGKKEEEELTKNSESEEADSSTSP